MATLDDPPVVVGLTTLPSRIGLLAPTLDSLLAQSRPPDRIVLAIPPTSRREGRGYELPPELTDEAAWDGRLEIVRTEDDHGPGTKLLGSLAAVSEPSILVVVDDDVVYAPYMLQKLVEAQRADHSRSFSFYAYREGGITVGQGCDGFSFWTPNLDGIADWAQPILDQPALFVHDDLWISFFLQRRGVRIRRILPDRGALVYEQLERESSLRELDGDLRRDLVHAEGLRYLMENESPTRRMRIGWQLWRTAERLGLPRLRHRLRRLLRAA